ncbi:MAG: hypothetical protein P9L99_05220 [Candidatus Lernaella stagnicola]|nr:hypothetical protein [Candidatus Lernaella stagnicola]
MKSISAKLGIWPNDKLLVIHPDERVVERIRVEHKGSITILNEPPAAGSVPMVLIWLREGDDATALANQFKPKIDKIGQLWFFFPKKEFMRKHQLTITRETVMQDVSRASMEMTKVCSIDAETQAMGFVLPLD